MLKPLAALWAMGRCAPCVVIALAVALFSVAALAQTTPEGPPLATIDLTTDEGVDRIGGAWRYSDVEIVETDFTLAGPDGQPGGPAARTYDIRPHAGTADFDDSGWEVQDPAALDARRGAGRVSFNWYRISGTSRSR